MPRAYGRKTVESRTVGTMGITSNDANFRTHFIPPPQLSTLSHLLRPLLKYIDASTRSSDLRLKTLNLKGEKRIGGFPPERAFLSPFCY